jgi:hypothetical protein
MTGIFHSSALPNDKNNQTSTRSPLHFADSATCTGLSETMDISHDSVNRFLLRESYTPADLFREASPLLCLEGGTLSVDDTVLDKPYSQKMERGGYFWSGKHRRVVKGRGLPVNYRVYQHADGKTKNDYFQEMLAEVIDWGLRPAFVSEGQKWPEGVPVCGRKQPLGVHRKGYLDSGTEMGHP